MKNNYKERILNVFIFASLVGILFLSIANITIENLDELWKYQWARNVVLGYVPYKDYSVVTTPLYLYLCSIPLFISNELIVFRFVESVGWGFLGYFIFKLLQKRVKAIIAYSCTLLLLALVTLIYFVFDYNTLALVFIFALIYVIEQETSEKVKYFLCGLICACADLTKQTVGVLLTIGFLIWLFLVKENTKKKVLTFLLGFVIPNMVFLFYLIFKGSFFLFFDQALFGLNSFKNNAMLFVTSFGVFGWVYASIPLLFFSYTTYKIIREHRQNLYIYIISEVVVLSLSIPICDLAHYMYFIMMTLFVFILYKGEVHIEDNIKKKYMYSAILIGLYSLVLFALKNPTIMSDEELITSEMPGLCYLHLDASSYANILGVDEYMKTNYSYNKVYYFTSGSCYFSIKNNISRGVYDLFLYGNVGTKTPLEYMEDLKNKDAVLVVRRSYATENRQNPVEILTYIQDNFELVDTYSIYDIYKVK